MFIFFVILTRYLPLAHSLTHSLHRSFSVDVNAAITFEASKNVFVCDVCVCVGLLLLLLWLSLLVLLFGLECIFSVPLWFIARRDTFTYYCGFGVSQKIPHFVVEDGCFCCCCVGLLLLLFDCGIFSDA